MSDWWQFDGRDDEHAEVQVDEVDTQERAALEAIHAIARMADTQPERALTIGAALRKISTISGSKAQSISLRSSTIKRARE